MEVKPMRILIADNQSKVRFALRVALEQRPGDMTIGEAVDAADLIEQSRAMCPDLALIDWELTGMPPADLLAQLRETCDKVHTIVLSSHAETRDRAIAAGANEFVCKCDAPEELMAAIDEYLAQHVGTRKG
jgi:DNA-binding NarL/FixJ family response regulator